MMYDSNGYYFNSKMYTDFMDSIIQQKVIFNEKIRKVYGTLFDVGMIGVVKNISTNSHYRDIVKNELIFDFRVTIYHAEEYIIQNRLISTREKFNHGDETLIISVDKAPFDLYEE